MAAEQQDLVAGLPKPVLALVLPAFFLFLFLAGYSTLFLSFQSVELCVSGMLHIPSV